MKWYRGGIHVHTIRSDGNSLPETAIDFYRNLGYHFVALTDHNEIHHEEKWIGMDWLRPGIAHRAMEEAAFQFGREHNVTREKDGKLELRLRRYDELAGMFDAAEMFLVLPGEEITQPNAHVNVIGNSTVVPCGGDNAETCIELAVKAVGHLAGSGNDVLGVVNHPNGNWWLTTEDLLAVKTIQFMEIHNSAPGCNNEGDSSHPSVDRMWDVVNTVRIVRDKLPPVFGVAADDAHSYFAEEWIGGRPGLAWIMVRADRLASSTLLASMRRGDFYSSTGVKLESVNFDPATKELSIEVDQDQQGECTITFIGSRDGVDINGREVAAVDKDGKPMRVSRSYDSAIGQTFAVVKGKRGAYRLAGNELYVRAVVDVAQTTAKNGRPCRAWTQPVGWAVRLIQTS